MAVRVTPFWKRFLLGLLSLVLATAVWLPVIHVFFAGDPEDYRRVDEIAPLARKLAARHIRLWSDPELVEQEIARMRSSNAEWDFMGRTFLVLALANMCLTEPALESEYLPVIDKIINETIRLEKEYGFYHFLMPYGRARPFVVQPARSVFVDGEIAVMLGARQMVARREDYQPMLRERVDGMIEQMEQGPVLSGECYPDECWTFCNSFALAAITISDCLDGRDHSNFCRRWIETAKRKLLDEETGLLVSSYTLEGYANDGPEGSTIWVVSHCLQLVDEAFAADQYARARKELGREMLGFGWAREWPESWQGPLDIDSGPVIPVLEVSPSASGLAFIGAAAFDDGEFLSRLIASLNFGGFPRQRDGMLEYCAGNQVGEAVVLYALTFGPLWQKVKDAKKT